MKKKSTSMSYSYSFFFCFDFQSDYLRIISLKMLTVEGRQYNAAGSSSYITADNDIRRLEVDLGNKRPSSCSRGLFKCVNYNVYAMCIWP